MFPLCVLRIDVNACGNDHAHFQKITPIRQPTFGLVLACSADGAMVPEQIFLCACAHYPIHQTTMYLHRWNTLRACVVVQSIRSHGKRTRPIYVYICVLQHISQCNTQEQWSVQTHTNNMFSLCVVAH